METTRVYQYGLLAPTANADLARAQLRAAHTFRNHLVEIERGYRYALRLLTVDLPEVSEVKRLEELMLEVKAEADDVRVKGRSRKLTPEVKLKLGVLKSALKDARAAARDARRVQAQDPAHILAREELKERRKAMMKAAYDISGLHWGTRALVVDAHEQSCKTTPIYADPPFRAWRSVGRHRMGVQVIWQTGKPARPESQIQIVESPTEDKRTGRSAGNRRVLRLRIGSNEDRSPVWAEFPMVMHRPLPPGARIMQAAVSMTIEGPRERWTVEVTIRMPVQKPSHGIGTVALNMGWRQMESGFRAAYCVDQLDNEFEFRLPAEVIGQLEKADSLRSIRDREQNTMATRVLDAVRGCDKPTWLTERLQYAHSWRSFTRWYALAKAWKDRRFDGDESAYSILEAWRYQDFHLWQWETAQRRKGLNNRREHYRVFAAGLARKYDTLLIQESGLERIARRPDITDEEWVNERARHNRFKGALSTLEMALKNAFISRGGTVHVFSATNNTQRCHHCREVCNFDAESRVMNTCQHCGETWDQDENNCRNLWARFSENPGDAETLSPARASKNPSNPGDRWGKAKAQRAENASRLEAAREAVGKAAE